MKLKIGTLFSGIGSPEKALKNLGIDYNLEYFCEFDKYAIKSYCVIHNELIEKNLGDITKIDIESLPKNLDLLVGGSPCQDFSLAGKRNGGDVNSKTRSSLMWNMVEIIRQTQPKTILWENVTGVLSDKMKKTYNKFINVLQEEGYKISAFTMNAKLYGVPQNRDRIFVLASKTHTIVKPEGYSCGIKLKDILENDVEEKYYLTPENIKKIKLSNFAQEKTRIQENDICGTILARDYKDPKVIMEKCDIVADLNHYKNDQMNRIHSLCGLSPTVETVSGGGREVKILEPIGCEVRVDEGIRTFNDGYMGTLRTIEACGGKHIIEPLIYNEQENNDKEPVLIGGVGEINFGKQFRQGNRIYDSEAIACALTASPVGNTGGESYLYKVNIDYQTPNIIFHNKSYTPIFFNKTEECEIYYITVNERQIGILKINQEWFVVRKLVPKECWRLMGFSDDDFYKVQNVDISNSQLYKQAGNSIVTNCLMAIFGEYYKVDWKNKVYGKWHKEGQSQFLDLPLFQ